MVNQKHLRILKQGAKVWNDWRNQYPEIRPNLMHVHLDSIGYVNQNGKEIKTNKEYLRGVNLSNADLRDTNLWKVDLSYADLRGANLQGSYMRDTNFYRANLSGAKFVRCILRSTIFTSTCLDETDFSNSEISLAEFYFTDISRAKGFDTCHTLDPVINITTIFLSKGRLSEAFLRGASVPPALIAYSKSLADPKRETVKSISILKQESIKLFYCYAREDEVLREKLAKHLHAMEREGLIVEWCDRQISAGQDYKQEILLHLETADIF